VYGSKCSILLAGELLPVDVAAVLGREGREEERERERERERDGGEG
jgi:hypothetical protein